MNPIILYDNRFLDGTPVATDTAADYSVLNIKDFRAYTFWKAASSGTKTIKVNCGSVKAADALGIIGHNFFTVGCTVCVESSTDGSLWTQRGNAFTATDNKAILKLFSTASAQHWQIKMTGCSAAPQIGEVLIGSRMTFPYPPNAPYSPYSEGIEAETALGKTGNILGSVIRYKPLEIAHNWASVERSWATGTFKPFWDNHASDLKPFFYAVDLDTFPTYVFFVAVQNGAKYTLPLSVLSLVDSISLEMVGVKEA